MKETKKEKSNLAHVLRYLRMLGKISSDKNFADAVGTTATTVSRNKNSGKPFDEKIMRGVYKAFGDVINIDYLRGESDVMLVKDLPTGNEAANSQETTPLQPDYSGLANATIAAKDEVIAELRSRLSDKDEIIRAKDANIADLHRQLADKDALIANLQQTIALRTKTAIEKGVLTHGTSPSAPVDHPCLRKNP